MNYGLLTSLLTLLAPIIIAALTGGGIVAYFQYRASRPESVAKARQINITAEISVADAWRQYAQAIERRFQDMETKYDKAIAQKDRENLRLNDRVRTLEDEIEKYRRMGQVVDKAH